MHCLYNYRVSQIKKSGREQTPTKIQFYLRGGVFSPEYRIKKVTIRVLLKGHSWYFYLVKKITIKIQLSSTNGTEPGEESVVSGTSEDIEDFFFGLGGWSAVWSAGFPTSDSALYWIHSATQSLPPGRWQAGAGSPLWWLTRARVDEALSPLLTRGSPDWRQHRISTISVASSEKRD